MKRAIYTPTGFPSFWEPEPIEVEFVCWEEKGMARVRVPFSENSIGAMVSHNAGRPHPPPWERLVPASQVQIIEAES